MIEVKEVNEQQTIFVIVHAHLHPFDYYGLQVYILKNTYWTQIANVYHANEVCGKVVETSNSSPKGW